jgi:CRISPR-associated protein Cas1
MSHVLAITEQGTQVHVEGELLLLSRGGRVVRRCRLAEISQVLLFGRIEVSSGAIAALARRCVEVVFLTPRGYFRARLCGPGTASAVLRLAQFRRALDPAFAVGVARAIVAAKVTHQRQLLLRAQRRLHDAPLADALGRMRLLAEQAGRETDLDRLRGLEGLAAALYFGQFAKLLRTSDLTFAGRSRRPPRDPVNACLSFGYTLLGNLLETDLLRCGLEPLVGFFHQPHHGRPSLALDLLEEFRPCVDALVLRLVNRRQLGPLDFERRGGPELEEILAETPPVESGGEGSSFPDPAVPGPEPDGAGPGVYLADAGRRVFLTEFFRRLRERIYYPPRAGAFELRDILREQAYHLARVIEGDAAYVPFVPG